MTSRERVLLAIFLGTIGLSAGVWGAELYLEKLSSLQDSLILARRQIGEYELALKDRRASWSVKESWKPSEAVDDVFLKELGKMVAGCGWKLDSATIHEKKGKTTLFQITIEGSNKQFGELLDGISRWNRAMVLQSIDARAGEKGRMIVQIEAGYEGP